MGSFRQTLACLLKAIGTLIERHVDHLETVEEVMMTLQGFVVLQAYYEDIVAELNKLAFVKAPPGVQMHRVVTLVEG